MDCATTLTEQDVNITSVVIGICGTGSTARCSDKEGRDWNSAIGCGHYQDETNPSQSSTVMATASDTNGWICGKSGTQLTCPSGSIMTGLCGSGGSDSCSEQCGSKSAFGVKCSKTPSPYMTADPGSANGWQNAQSTGEMVTCPIGQVACGACMSDSDKSCNGNYARLRCCDVESPVTFSGYQGNWVQVTINADQTITAGMSWSEEESWMYSTTFEYGLSEEAGAEFGAFSMSTSATQTWSSTTETTVSNTNGYEYSMSCNAPCSSGVLYQWTTTATGSDGQTQSTKDCEYQCVPQYISNGTPKCPVGYCADAACQCCNNFWRADDNTVEGNRISVYAVDADNNSLGGTCVTPTPGGSATVNN